MRASNQETSLCRNIVNILSSDWYSKLHSIGTKSQEESREKPSSLNEQKHLQLQNQEEDMENTNMHQESSLGMVKLLAL
jgi:hypothetical protein